ncbi:Oligosaccharyltransferase subunit Ribophorin II-domain-containing protein [Ustulina deusta]|nr:Oligosaccharyltransferase subunit Ribophorin II-domain-containing protein [Ustulina deusta]KAI3340800.1 Oligosaccharyltransferase subunit Ribophorin II-domain-containing protein [Ustulina deusta]
MRFLHSLVTPLVLLAAGAAQAASASSWGFDDATVQVNAKKGAGSKERFSETKPLSHPVAIGNTESIKVLLVAKDDGKGKRPHQAFVVLQDELSGLEAPFPMTVKENGKAVVDIKYADLPVQLATSTAPLKASVVLASFGSSQGLNTPVFSVTLKTDPNATPLVYEKPLRYGKRELIHHTFRADPKNPPKIISAFFSLAVLATVPVLFVGWLALGANVSHLQSALRNAPIAHGVFFGSLVALEGVFYLYYVSWTLFEVLPIIGVVGAATFLSGVKALSEVQSRRLAGER